MNVLVVNVESSPLQGCEALQPVGFEGQAQDIRSIPLGTSSPEQAFLTRETIRGAVNLGPDAKSRFSLLPVAT